MRRVAVPAYYVFDTGPTSARGTVPSFEAVFGALPDFDAFFGAVEDEIEETEADYEERPETYESRFGDGTLLAEYEKRLGARIDWLMDYGLEAPAEANFIHYMESRYDDAVSWLRSLDATDTVHRQIGLKEDVDAASIEPLGVFWCAGHCGDWVGPRETMYLFRARHNPDAVDWLGSIAVNTAYGDILPEVRYLRGSELYVIDCEVVSDVGLVEINAWREV